MADFNPPFASVGGVNRSPTTDEQSDGFQCGAADLTLFNRLVGRIEAELKAIQDEGGIPGTESDDTTVLQAIQAMIAAATGGADTSNYVLFTQAQARLPIFPEIQTSDGTMDITSPGTGTIRIPASVTVLHRGIRTYVTVQTDIVTTASKIYHLRWSPSGGFVLKDLADIAYNPTVAPESNAAFDSSYDDMLVARVVTNSSNVPNITKLANRDRLFRNGNTSGVAAYIPDSAIAYQFSGSLALNWARTPQIKSVTGVVGASSVSNGAVDGGCNLISTSDYTRYVASATVFTDWQTGTVISGPTGSLNFNIAS